MAGMINMVTGFLSTPSVGRATGGALSATQAPGISIHALRGEGDPLTEPVTRTHW